MTKRRGKRREKGNGRGSRPDPRETRLIDKAGRLIEDGRAEEALELIEPALERRPESADLHFTRAYAREARGSLGCRGSP